MYPRLGWIFGLHHRSPGDVPALEDEATPGLSNIIPHNIFKQTSLRGRDGQGLTPSKSSSAAVPSEIVNCAEGSSGSPIHELHGASVCSRSAYPE